MSPWYDVPLVCMGRGNRALRYVLLLIAENLLKCNDRFPALAAAWREAGVHPRARVVRAAKRFCWIAYPMVAGGRVYRHASCRERHYILEKLFIFYGEHETPAEQVLGDLRAAAEWIPEAEYAAEAARLPAPAARLPAPAACPRAAGRPPASNGRRTGPRPLTAILPEVLLRSGVMMVESSPSGEADPT